MSNKGNRRTPVAPRPYSASQVDGFRHQIDSEIVQRFIATVDNLNARLSSLAEEARWVNHNINETNWQLCANRLSNAVMAVEEA